MIAGTVVLVTLCALVLFASRRHPASWDGGITPPNRPMDNRERFAAWAARYYLNHDRLVPDQHPHKRKVNGAGSG